MGNFAITFRFKSDPSYQDRYDSFVKKVMEIASSHPWAETSSFFALEANETAESLCHRLWVETDFDSAKDIMLIIDTHNQKKATKGPVQYPNLLSKGLGF